MKNASTVRRRVAVLLVVLVSVSVGTVNADAPIEGVQDLSFANSTLDGEPFRLDPSAVPHVTVVCFLGTECPLARLYGPRLQRVADEFADQNVRFVGVYSNRQDSSDDIREFAETHGIRFPSIRDAQNVLADRFQASRTPEVFALDSHLSIRYQGRIDDQYQPGVARKAPERHDLREALRQITSDKVVQVPMTKSEGCLIGRVKTPQADSEVTYCDQVIRLLNRQCVECHREGEIGPFALTDYDEVVGWSDMILEVVQDGRMPPWHASSDYATFANARSITEQEKGILARWVTAGSPFGDASLLPKLPEFVAGWQLPRAPDLVIEMRNRPFTVPADGTVEYQYFVVDPELKEDRWITAAQVIPGNPTVVHHSIVFIRPPDGARFRGVGWLAAYVPGQRTFVLPPGRARFIPAGSKLVFQQHYTPNGKVQEDLTRVGVLFADASDVTHEVITLIGIDQEFEIPPHAPNYTVVGQVDRFPRDGELLAIMPHMHLRGKSFQFCQTSGKREKVILDVPRYDFNWQHVYELADAMPLKDIDQLKFIATFDNSSSNPFNPDPSQYVTWGDQTWEEMAVAFFEVAEPLTVADSIPAEQTVHEQRLVEQQLVEQQQKVDQVVTQFFSRFDRNQDGVVERMETPLSFRQFGFRRYDSDGNERLTREEIQQEAQRRER